MTPAWRTCAQLQSFMALAEPPAAALPHVRACYPFVRLRTTHSTHPDTRLAYGFVAHAGHYETTLTRPDLFADYYREQFGLLLASHDAPLEVGISNQPIPCPSALPTASTSTAACSPGSAPCWARCSTCPT
jgi:AMP nucleosidase